MIISRRRFEAAKIAAADEARQDLWREQERQRDLQYIRESVYRLEERVAKLEGKQPAECTPANVRPL